jgi:hypothetical protein
MKAVRQAVIKAISFYLPEAVLTNRRLAAEMGDWTEAKTGEKTGIQEVVRLRTWLGEASGENRACLQCVTVDRLEAE